MVRTLSPAGRRKLAAEIAKELRRSQQQRIKRAMFQKLRTNRYMKASGRNDTAVVEFTGKVQRIARVHHFGLKDRPNRHIKDVQYSARTLLGFSKEVIKNVEQCISVFLVNKGHF